MLGMRRACIEHPYLVRLEASFQRVQEHCGIVCCPEVQIQCVQPIHVFAFVAEVVRWQVPLRSILLWSVRLADGDREKSWMLVGVIYVRGIEDWTPLKSALNYSRSSFEMTYSQ